MNLVKYPAHSDDAFLVTTDRGLNLIKKMCVLYGTTQGTNSYKFDLPRLKESAEYKDWVAVNERLAQDLRLMLARDFGPMNIPGCVCMDPMPKATEPFADDILVYGVELGTQGLENWQLGAIHAVYKRELGCRIRWVDYGSADHKYWLSFVQD